MTGAVESTEGLRRFRPYPEYKDSCVDWLSEMPADWEAKRLRFTVALNPTKSEVRGLPSDTAVSFLPMEFVGEYGGLVLDETRPLESVMEGYTYFRDGDVVLAKITPCFENGKGALATNLENGIAFGTTELHVLRPSAELDVRFLFYLTLSDHFRGIGAADMYGAGGQKRVSDDFIRNFSHPLPSVTEQRAIAEFLERETGKIDALVAKKERLIELLQEKRTALITQAVTKGLDPTAPPKPSGIDWLGDIPAHWEAGALSRWWDVIDCKHRTVPFVDEGIPVASIGEVHGLEVDLSSANRTTEEEYHLMIGGGRDPRPSDIIYSRNATVGEAALVTDCERFCMGQDVALIRSRDQDQRFLVFLLRSPALMGQLDSLMVGSTFKRINVGQIKRFTVCRPPISEQVQIAEYSAVVHERIQRLIDRFQDGVERISEFRTALISAAVTGKIDVREEVA